VILVKVRRSKFLVLHRIKAVTTSEK